MIVADADRPPESVTVTDTGKVPVFWKAVLLLGPPQL
jgi:hypothetical protein